VNEFTTAIIGLPICSSFIPLARQRARAPAMRRPCVLVALLNWCIMLCSTILILIIYKILGKLFQNISDYRNLPTFLSKTLQKYRFQ
jgi:hypothetical protein